jgi:hypothetical protein
LAFLAPGIPTQNLYNRIHVTTRQVAAVWGELDPEATQQWSAATA